MKSWISEMKMKRNLLARFACALVLASGFALPTQAQAQNIDKDKACLECHAALAQKKVVHAAVHMGCSSCHNEAALNTVPHKSRSRTAKERSAENAAMCASCHDKKLFAGKVVHAPIAAGECTDCHDPHASDNQGLLKKEPATLCLDCHSDIKKGPHVVAGFSRAGHPLGDEKKEAKDPLRPGKAFYCGSCHEPHSSDRPKLNRFGLGMVACQKCHQK